MTPMSGLDAIRLLLAVGFRVGRSTGGEAALEREGRIVYVAPERELSDETVRAILEAARIEPAELGTILAQLRARDTLPDLTAA